MSNKHHHREKKNLYTKKQQQLSLYCINARLIQDENKINYQQIRMLHPLGMISQINTIKNKLLKNIYKIEFPISNQSYIPKKINKGTRDFFRNFIIIIITRAACQLTRPDHDDSSSVTFCSLSHHVGSSVLF